MSYTKDEERVIRELQTLITIQNNKVSEEFRFDINEFVKNLE